MKPLVSILIPAYNAGRWTAETLNSALAQTWQKKEIIVVDDGSTDQTLSVARQFASRSVLVVTHQNQGAAAARNKAFDLSQGDYIQWLDADDLLAPTKIEMQLRALQDCQSERTLLSGPYGTFYYRTEKARFSPSPLWCDLSIVEWLLRKMGQNCHMQTATWLTSRTLTNAAGPWDTRLLGDDDGEYFCRVKMASTGITFVPEARVFYRLTDSNRLSYIGRSNKKLEAQFLSMQLHIAYLRSLEDSERTRTACLRYLQKYMFDFCPERPDIVDQMQGLAASLGGQLRPPTSSWKYAWIEKAFGWELAKQAQLNLPQLKHSLLKYCDKALYRLQNAVDRNAS